ncbi:MAG: NADH-quinone oxidoreductase subunit M, partial [Deltaproteobacteria bacterium]
MTFFPLIGIAVILLLPRGKDDWVKYVSVIATAVPLLLGIYVYTHFNVLFDGRGAGGELFQKFQFQEGPIPWIESFNIEYFMGIDGLSVPMVLLTALLGFICIFASWGIDKGVKGYFSLFLLLETGMMGTFCALDFFLFFIFWEVMLLPMYFLIGIWGAPPRKEADGRVRGGPYAAIKFFLYTLLGSALMLVAMLALYFVDGQHT